MPDLYDSIPPEPFRDFRPAAPQPPRTPAPAPTTPSRPQSPSPQRSRPQTKPKGPQVPEIAISDTERLRPNAAAQRKIQGELKWVLSPEGVIGDLDAAGLDLLAGHIALVNGVGFAASPTFRHRNPGAFGIHLWPAPGTSLLHFLPRRDGPHAAPWMNQIFDDLQHAGPSTKPPDARTLVGPVTFPSWRAGGEALMGFLRNIQNRQIPFFYRGPMTPIAEVLLCFESPCACEHTFRWSDLEPVLERHRTAATDPVTATRT